MYGLGGAFAFRFVAILFSTFVMKMWWLQAIGAGYLLFVPLKHFWGHASSSGPTVKPGASFWGTVIAVELTDIAFAVDSILAGVALVRGDASKIWVVFLGAVIGIVLLRFAASAFIRLLEKYPAFDHVAYLLVGWVGIKLAFLAAHTFDKNVYNGSLHIHELPLWLFWGVLALIVVVGSWMSMAFKSKVVADYEDEINLIEESVE